AALFGVAAAAQSAGATPNPAMVPMAAGRDGVCTTADQNAVTVVIDYQNLGGGIKKYCASNLPKGAVGMDALKAVGVGTAGTTHDGTAFVCRINGRPAAKESITIPGDSEYHEHCVDTPPATAYWSYWWAKPGGSWVYSDKGVLSHRVVIGGYEGWSFSNDPDGGYGGKNPAPGLKPVAWQDPPKPSTPKPAPTRSKSPSPQPVKPKPTGSSKPQPSQSSKPAPIRSASVTPSATATPSATPGPNSPVPTESESATWSGTAVPASPTPGQTAAEASPPPPSMPAGEDPAALQSGSGPGAELMIGGALVVAVAGTAIGVAVRSRRNR
ncbi:MAG: hypothetical protein VB036_12930, partial [Propionicimonas sp.]|nr:hypothetical protein [Propionicimonas sp.]